jgi:hypothetical protein
VRPAVAALLGDPDSALPAAVRPALQSALDELAALEERLRTLEQHLAALAAELPAVASLRTIPGVGLLTATALVGFVGDAYRFPTARHFASFLDLTPREHSSGARRRLGVAEAPGGGSTNESLLRRRGCIGAPLAVAVAVVRPACGHARGLRLGHPACRRCWRC